MLGLHVRRALAHMSKVGPYWIAEDGKQRPCDPCDGWVADMAR